jgi:hypothetical protein
MLVVNFAYYHYSLPAPKSTLGTVALSILSGLIVEVLVFLAAHWQENFFERAGQIRERHHVTLIKEVQDVTKSALGNEGSVVLEEGNINVRLARIYERVFSTCNDSWDLKAQEFLEELRIVQADYMGLRADYLSFVEETCRQCSEYFASSVSNLRILNTVAKKIKERAIEPSFKLLNKTEQDLRSAKQDVEAIRFT